MNRRGLSMNEMMQRRAGQIAKLHENGEGRPLEELKKTADVLKGAESLRLRIFCTSNCMEPGRDLDVFGRVLLAGSLEEVKIDFAEKVREKMKTLNSESATKSYADELHARRWGPTEVPIFNLLGLFALIVPNRRMNYISIAEFYLKSGIPVDGRDLSGTTALSHCFSTKPACDLTYAALLFDAGGDVNSRNRYGSTVAHEIVQIYDRNNPEVVGKATQSFQWFLSHGGNVDIADSDGMTPRFMVTKLGVPALKRLVEEEDNRRKIKGSSCCSCCGREESKLLACGKCKKAMYCNPKLRACQKLDWPKHKKECKAV